MRPMRSGCTGRRGCRIRQTCRERGSGAISWTDPSGDLWLFGGTTDAASSGRRLNDLWRWDGTNWTWVSGSDGVDQLGTYGTRGVAELANVPGARQVSIAWTGARRGPLALRRLRLRGDPGRLDRIAQRPLEVGRNELDLGERVERRRPARCVRRQGLGFPGERAGSEDVSDLLDRHGRKPLAIRGQRHRLRRPGGIAERPLGLRDGLLAARFADGRKRRSLRSRGDDPAHRYNGRGRHLLLDRSERLHFHGAEPDDFERDAGDGRHLLRHRHHRRLHVVERCDDRGGRARAVRLRFEDWRGHWEDRFQPLRNRLSGSVRRLVPERLAGHVDGDPRCRLALRGVERRRVCGDGPLHRDHGRGEIRLGDFPAGRGYWVPHPRPMPRRRYAERGGPVGRSGARGRRDAHLPDHRPVRCSRGCGSRGAQRHGDEPDGFGKPHRLPRMGPGAGHEHGRLHRRENAREQRDDRSCRRGPVGGRPSGNGHGGRHRRRERLLSVSRRTDRIDPRSEM